MWSPRRLFQRSGLVGHVLDSPHKPPLLRLYTRSHRRQAREPENSWHLVLHIRPHGLVHKMMMPNDIPVRNHPDVIVIGASRTRV